MIISIHYYSRSQKYHTESTVVDTFDAHVLSMYVLEIHVRTLFNFDHEINIFNDIHTYFHLFLLLHS